MPQQPPNIPSSISATWKGYDEFQKRLARIWAMDHAELFPKADWNNPDPDLARQVFGIQSTRPQDFPGVDPGHGMQDTRAATAQLMSRLKGTPHYDYLNEVAPGFSAGVLRGLGGGIGDTGESLPNAEPWGEMVGRIGGMLPVLHGAKLATRVPGMIGAAAKLLPAGARRALGSAAYTGAQDFLQDSPAVISRAEGAQQSQKAYSHLLDPAGEYEIPPDPNNPSLGAPVPGMGARIASAGGNALLDALSFGLFEPAARSIASKIVGPAGGLLRRGAARAANATFQTAPQVAGGTALMMGTMGVEPDPLAVGGMGALFTGLGMTQKPVHFAGTDKEAIRHFFREGMGDGPAAAPGAVPRANDAADEIVPDQAEVLNQLREGQDRSRYAREQLGLGQPGEGQANLPAAALQQALSPSPGTAFSQGGVRPETEAIMAALGLRMTGDAVDVSQPATMGAWAGNAMYGTPRVARDPATGAQSEILGRLPDKVRWLVAREGKPAQVNPYIVRDPGADAYSLRSAREILANERRMPLRENIQTQFRGVTLPPDFRHTPGKWGEGMPVVIGDRQGLIFGYNDKDGMAIVAYPDPLGGPEPVYELVDGSSIQGWTDYLDMARKEMDKKFGGPPAGTVSQKPPPQPVSLALTPAMQQQLKEDIAQRMGRIPLAIPGGSGATVAVAGRQASTRKPRNKPASTKETPNATPAAQRRR